MGKGEAEWSNGLCGCLNNYGTCCCGYLCRPCQMGDNAQKLGDSYLLCCFASICVPCIPAFILRQKTRERYNINGDSCEDALASIFCACCTSVQIANELNDKGA